jgi:hypothetical protein
MCGVPVTSGLSRQRGSRAASRITTVSPPSIVREQNERQRMVESAASPTFSK